MRNSGFAERVGRLIRELREAAGYGQESFADEIRVHRNYMSKIELGKSAVSFEIIEQICQTLHISMADFCARLETPEGAREQRPLKVGSGARNPTTSS